MKTGAIPERVSHIRNYEYELVCGAVSNFYPITYEIDRSNTGTLRNQRFMDCVAKVIAQLAEAYYSKELEPEDHSEEFIYGALREDTSRSEGMIVSVAMDLWTKIGTIPKKYFDISAEMPEIKEIVAKYPDLYEMAFKYKIRGHIQFRNTGSSSKDSQIKDALLKYGRGLVAVSPNGFAGGSHCIMITGWDDNKGTYKFKNSWGENYGDNGFSEIRKDEISEVYMPIFEPITLPFVDVNEDDWFYDAVKHVYFSGMMEGTSTDTFEPDKPFTRAEAAVVINRLLKNIDERFDILNRVQDDKKEYLE